ncbi:DUF3168 domain-containing protein [Hyphomicrobium sp. MC1]|uniref:DUF3168 domain-containing protein n=1 Tax=Hyphomicrobium sp. (strain MC1) TaxID=717785 RepID=UPI000213EB2A|nr:DUF3168 domain-containing protein [Hyphomicrobium sp. MC1]CCB65397.1 conserved protein of unknown function [Hyphomicrobium sp. MC1]
MLEPSLDLQKALRLRLIATAAVTNLVPATSILDTNARPEQMPCIRIGTGQALQDDGIARNRWHVYMDLHIFANEVGLAAVKEIAGAISQALRNRFFELDSHYCGDVYTSGARYMRDPDGVHSHAIVSIEARLIEVAA